MSFGPLKQQFEVMPDPSSPSRMERRAPAKQRENNAKVVTPIEKLNVSECEPQSARPVHCDHSANRRKPLANVDPRQKQLTPLHKLQDACCHASSSLSATRRLNNNPTEECKCGQLWGNWNLIINRGNQFTTRISGSRPCRIWLSHYCLIFNMQIYMIWIMLTWIMHRKS